MRTFVTLILVFADELAVMFTLQHHSAPVSGGTVQAFAGEKCASTLVLCAWRVACLPRSASADSSLVRTSRDRQNSERQRAASLT